MRKLEAVNQTLYFFILKTGLRVSILEKLLLNLNHLGLETILNDFKNRSNSSGIERKSHPKTAQVIFALKIFCTLSFSECQLRILRTHFLESQSQGTVL